MATILVIDDEAPIVDLLVDIIEESGHTALQASNGLEGLHVARSACPDLILCDVMMPLLDGYGLLAQLRAEPELDGTTIILMSAAFASGFRPAVDPPPDGFLPKPFDLPTIEQFLADLADR